MKDYYGKDFSGLKNKKLWLFDMDGTIYLGNTLFNGVIDLLSRIVENGFRDKQFFKRYRRLFK